MNERAKHDCESDQLRIEKLVRQRDELSKKLEILREYGVEVVDAVGGGYEVYNKVVCERDELQARLDAIQSIFNDSDLLNQAIYTNYNKYTVN